MMKNKILFAIAGLFLLVPAYAQAQIIQGYQSMPKPGIRWQWKAFQETLSVDVSATGTEWVKANEQAIYGDALRMFIPKGETLENAQEAILIGFTDYNYVPKTVPLDIYVKMAEDTGRLSCGSRQDAYSVKVLKKTEKEIMVQLTSEGCMDPDQSKEHIEIRRVIKGPMGTHSISYTMHEANVDENKILEMIKVLKSATIIDGKSKS